MQQPKEKLTGEVRKEVMRRIERSVAFQRVFSGGKDSDLVLNELKMLCRGFDPDPYIHAYNAGTTAVYNFIQTTMNQDVESARKVLEEQKKETTDA